MEDVPQHLDMSTQQFAGIFYLRTRGDEDNEERSVREFAIYMTPLLRLNLLTHRL